MQAGLTKWVGGKNRQPPTRGALLELSHGTCTNCKTAHSRSQDGPQPSLKVCWVHYIVYAVSSDCGFTVTQGCEAADLLLAAHLIYA